MSLKFLPAIIKAAPEKLVRLTFSNGVEVVPGKELSSHQIRTQPEISWDADLNELYTLLLVDSIATSREICHWLVINIPGNQIYRGKVLVEYNVPMTLFQGKGLHRFICLVFKQADIITTETFIFKITNHERIIVKTNDYKTKYNLGAPIAGSYYKVRGASYGPVK